MRTLDQIMGAYNGASDDKRPRTKRLTDRPGDEIFLVAHHAYAYTIQQIENTFFSAYREVCANAGVGPQVAGSDRYIARQYARWNTERAYTTGSWVDDQAITFEMANLSLDPPYKVGQTGKQWAAEVAAAMHVELGMPLDRWHVTCHREIHERGWGSYATACPGDDLHDALDWIVAEAKRIVAASNTTNPESEEDDDMHDFKPTVHARVDNGKQTEWMRAHPGIGADLEQFTGAGTGTKRKSKDGKVTTYRGFEVTTDPRVFTAWARTHCRGTGQITSATERNGYIDIQIEASRLSAELA